MRRGHYYIKFALMICVIAINYSLAQDPSFPIEDGGWMSHPSKFIPPVTELFDSEAFNFPNVDGGSLQPIPAAVTVPAMATPTPRPHDFAITSPDAFKKIDDNKSPSIVALAKSLGDVASIFLYVRDKITTEHQPKAIKGASVTLSVGSGGMSDKAALLMALLTAAGHSAEYHSGDVRIPLVSRNGFDFISYTGKNPHGIIPVSFTDIQIRSLSDSESVGGNDSPVHSALRYMGMDVVMENNPEASSSVVIMKRLWIAVSTPSGAIHLDPSFPTRFFVPGLPADQAWSTYNRDSFLAAAGGSLVHKGLAIKGINVEAIKRQLEAVSEQWFNYFSSSQLDHGRTTNDLISKIVEYNPEISKSTSHDSLNLWGCPWRVGWIGNEATYGQQITNIKRHAHGAMPNDFVVSLALYSGQKNGTLNEFTAPLLLPALEGKRLSLVVSNASVGEGSLKIDDLELQNKAIGNSDSKYFEIRINGVASYFPESITRSGFQVEKDTRHVLTYLNRVSAKLIDDRTRLLPAFIDKIEIARKAIQRLQSTGGDIAQKQLELEKSIRQAELESLHLVALSWLHRTQLLSEICVGFDGNEVSHLWRYGRAAYSPKPLVDFFLQFESVNQRSTPEVYAASLAARGWLSSALEHSVLENLISYETQALSTANIISSLAEGEKPIWVIGSESSSFSQSRSCTAHIEKRGPWSYSNGPLQAQSPVVTVSQAAVWKSYPYQHHACIYTNNNGRIWGLGGYFPVERWNLSNLASKAQQWFWSPWNQPLLKVSHYNVLYFYAQGGFWWPGTSYSLGGGTAVGGILREPPYYASGEYYIQTKNYYPSQTIPVGVTIPSSSTSETYIPNQSKLPDGKILPNWVINQNEFDNYKTEVLETARQIDYRIQPPDLVEWPSSHEVLEDWWPWNRYVYVPARNEPQLFWEYYAPEQTQADSAYYTYLSKLQSEGLFSHDLGAISVYPTTGIKPTVDGKEIYGSAFCSLRRIAMTISGGDFYGFGGFTITNGDLNWNHTYRSLSSDPDYLMTINPVAGDSASLLFRFDSLNAFSFDPIDLRTGAYVYDATDAQIRSRPQLDFKRHYSSNRTEDNSANLGYGWTHNHYRRLSLISDFDSVCASQRPEDAAEILVAYLISRDLMLAARQASGPIISDVEAKKVLWQNHQPIPVTDPVATRAYQVRAQATVAAAIAGTWAIDNVANNTVIVHEGAEARRFIRKPGSSNAHISPPGLKDLKLTKEPNYTYVLQRRNAGKIIYYGAVCILDEDADGNALEYSYQDDVLSSVVARSAQQRGITTNGAVGSTIREARPAALHFVYNANKLLTKVNSLPASEAGLINYASYEYSTDGKALRYVKRQDSGADTSKKWQYNYNNTQECLLVKLVDADGRTVAVNEYDQNKRVKRQWQGPYTQLTGEEKNQAAWVYDWLVGESRETLPLKTNPSGATTRYIYDNYARLVKIIDAEGNSTEYSHDDEDNVVLECRIDSSDNVLSQTSRQYDTNGLLKKSISLNSWNAKTHLINGQVSEEAFPQTKHAITSYFYDDLERLHITRDARGLETEYLYADLDPATNPNTARINEIREGSTRITRFEHDANGNICKMIHPGPNNRQTLWEYDQRGNLYKETRPDNHWTRYQWDIEPNLYSGPSHVMSPDQYDNNGTLVTCFRGSFTSISRLDDELTITTRLGLMIETGGLLRTSTDANKFESYYKMDSSGNKTTEKSDNGGIWKYLYDGLGHRTKVIEPLDDNITKIESTTSYDSRGWVSSQTNPLNQRVNITRNKFDRPEVVTDPRNKKVETLYDAVGRVKSVRQLYKMHGDSTDRYYETIYQYLGGTSLARAITDANSGTYYQAYNEIGQRVSLTNRMNQKWLFSYDEFGRLNATQTPLEDDGRKVIHQQIWSPHQNILTASIEPSGQTTHYLEYDKAERLLRRRDDVNNPGTDTRFTYDNSGRLLQTQENGKGLTRTYAASGNLRSYTNERFEKFFYEYRNDGLLKSITYPALRVPGQTFVPVANKTVRYTYDNHKRLKTVTDWGAREATYSYDAAGRLTKLLRQNGSTLLSTRTWKYDASGQLKEIKDVNARGQVIVLYAFAHDAVGRPVRRLALPHAYGAGVPLTGTSVGADNRLLTISGQNAGYDGDGNLLSFADNLYAGSMSQLAYDARNRLTSATLGGKSSSFTYDAEGHRQSLTVGSGATAQTTTYTVNPHAALSQCVARRTGNNITWAVHGLGLLWEVEEVFNTASTALKLKDVLYHHHDQVGNTAVVSNLKGQDVIWVQYDVYGQVVACQVPQQRASTASGTPPARPADAGAKLVTSLTTTTNPAGRPELDNNTLTPQARALLVTPYLYSGAHGVMTDPTGLIHMRARYYHPGLRRFVNQDPIGFGGGMNWFAYANGNPIMNSDPSGLMVPNPYGQWKNSDGSINWPVYIMLGLQGVPDYLAQNGWSSFKRNITDPKFIMENAGGGFGIAGALNRVTQTTGRVATATTRIGVAVGDDMSSAAGTTVWRQVAEGHPSLGAAQQGAAIPNGAASAASLEARAMAHDIGQTAGSGMTSWTADLRFAQMRQAQSGGVILQGVAPEGSFWMNASGAAFGSVEAQVLIPGISRGIVLGGQGASMMGGLGTLGGLSMFGNAVGQGIGRK